jgi:hypothetical protein
MYIRISDTGIIWPYSIEQLKQDEPGTSFPADITLELLSNFNVFEVIIDSRPVLDPNQECIAETPVLENGQWIQKWSIIESSEQSRIIKLEQLAGDIRQTRHRLLQESDWTQSKDIPDSTSELWKPYRQALRDITLQTNFPIEVVWPIPPG